MTSVLRSKKIKKGAVVLGSGAAEAIGTDVKELTDEIEALRREVKELRSLVGMLMSMAEAEMEEAAASGERLPPHFEDIALSDGFIPPNN